MPVLHRSNLLYTRSDPADSLSPVASCNPSRGTVPSRVYSTVPKISRLSEPTEAIWIGQLLPAGRALLHSLSVLVSP